MNKRFKFLIIILGMALAVAEWIAASPAADYALSTSELDAFRTAVETLGRTPVDPAAARAARVVLSELAALLEARAETDSRAWYDAGNARWWANEPAKAIMAYRRFLAHYPFRTEVWENLEAARLAAGTIRPGGEGFGVWPWSLWLLSAAAGLFGLAAGVFGIFAWTRRPVWLKIGLTVAALTLLCGAGVGLSATLRPRLAIVVREAQGRKGDSDVYAASPERPWPAGQEGWVRERRSGWLRLRIAGADTWLSESAVELIGD